MIFLALTEPSTTKTMMVKRELEISSQWLPEEVLETLDEVKGIDIAAFPGAGGGMFYYMMNTKKPPLDDIHVRKAVAYAFDYETVVKEIFKGALNTLFIGAVVVGVGDVVVGVVTGVVGLVGEVGLVGVVGGAL